MPNEYVDVLIIGAGLSGVGAARHLQQHCPKKTFALLEGRQAMGGTWDLFRYPGIRSDSDMFTLGYNFKPWTNPKAIADGPSIREYIQETAYETGIDRHIRYGHKVKRASWSSQAALWTVEVEREGQEQTQTIDCHFIVSCTGYYNYAAGYSPEFSGSENFAGKIVHPQHWPEDLDYAGKKVVVIGSGATAVTLIPAMAEKTAHITMLQRSPTYVATVPERDEISEKLRKFLPEKIVYRLARTRNVAFQMLIYRLCLAKPETMRRLLLQQVRKQVGPDFDMKHFTPHYNPWEERLCAVPDGDLFKTIRKGKASVVTDHIDHFTETGILLKSGETLDADIIVTATGIDLQIMGGIDLSVDGVPFDVSKSMAYKAIMFSDLPNLAMMFGYTNASWTLKSDISSEYVCRLLKHMDRKGLQQCTPRNSDPSVDQEPFLNFRAGYVQRAAAKFPRQGTKAPWRIFQNYALDLASLRLSGLDDGAMEFSNPAPKRKSFSLGNLFS